MSRRIRLMEKLTDAPSFIIQNLTYNQDYFEAITIKILLNNNSVMLNVQAKRHGVNGMKFLWNELIDGFKSDSFFRYLAILIGFCIIGYVGVAIYVGFFM